MPSGVLVTGGAGFIGAHTVEHIYKNTDWNILILDRLSYAGSLDRLAQFKGDPRVKFVFHDFRAQFPESLLGRLERLGVEYIIHAGAETHVDRSLADAEPFVTSNVVGTYHMLEAARKLSVAKFIMVSTDEVHGPAPIGISFKEDSPIRPSNPYAGTKAGAEALAYSYAMSHGIPVVITRTMNNFGERQHPEKFVPKALGLLLSGDEVPIHAVGTRIGSRKWLHARNHADALLFLLKKKTQPGDTFHIAGEEKSNLEIARQIADIIGKPCRWRQVDAHTQRPGHDLRYSLDDTKIRKLGWNPPMDFNKSFEKTIRWTTSHSEWLAPALEAVHG